METKILIIDDEKAMRLMTITVLNHYGYTNVLEAASGEVGIEIIQKEHPDFVMTDLTMPGGMRGEQVLQWVVREYKPGHPNIKLMAYSGDGQKTTESVARAAGADSFLAKPFRPQTLMAAVESLLGVQPPPPPDSQPEAAGPTPS